MDRLVEEGDPSARTVRAALRELSFQLSGAQLGITLSALLTGYLAEPALARLFAPALAVFGTASSGVSHALALILATLISMLFGELIPKNAAIARPWPTARLTARSMRLFSWALAWLIRALNDSANWIVRRLGIEPQEELRSARSPDELGLLAAYSAKAGALPEDTALLLRRTIRFSEKRAAEAMTPRIDVIGIGAGDPVSALVEVVRETGKSRFPVYGASLDEIVGIVTVVDILRVPPARRPETLVGSIAKEAVLVPESLDLDGVLATLQAQGASMAIVVDEYGGTDGVVTIEDLVEELVGDILDEHDRGESFSVVAVDQQVEVAATSPWSVDGVLRADELEEQTGFRLPEGPYETLAGFLMDRLGRIPQEGDVISEHGWAFHVEQMNLRRVERVLVEAPIEVDHG